jgi:hypothetical protein
MAPNLREGLAELAHDRWSHWMSYLFSEGTLNPDGSWTIPVELAERWQRQMNTPYSGLTEAEKASDRLEADRILAFTGG